MTREFRVRRYILIFDESAKYARRKRCNSASNRTSRSLFGTYGHDSAKLFAFSNSKSGLSLGDPAPKMDDERDSAFKTFPGYAPALVLKGTKLRIDNVVSP